MRQQQSPRESRKRSEQIRESMIGTHVSSTSRKAARQSMKFSGGRAKSYDGIEIDHLMPGSGMRDTSTRTRRRKQPNFSSNVSTTDKNRLVLVAIVVAGLALAVVVGFAVARHTLSSSLNDAMALNDSSVDAVLSAPDSAADPFYTLIIGEFGKDGYDGPALIELAYVDPSSKKTTFISIPSDTTATLSDGNKHPICQAQMRNGDAGLIEAVEKLMGVDVAHFVKLNKDGFVSLVDKMGGLDVYVAEEVDDPDVGTLYIPKGQQTLDGESALVYCRADNYKNPRVSRQEAQDQVMRALLDKLAQGGWMGDGMFGSIGGFLKTDMDYDQLKTVFDTVTGEDAVVYSGLLPGIAGSDSDGSYYTVSDANISTILDAVVSGEDPSVKASDIVDPSGVTVEIQNGAGIDGSASEVSDALAERGYDIKSTSNAESYVYEETLVIYKDSDKLSIAQAISETLGTGRALDAGTYYTFDTDILVIIGGDYKPLK